jgi:hypothetical protein
MLKRILKKQDLRKWSGFNCVHILVLWVVTPCILVGGDPENLSFELLVSCLFHSDAPTQQSRMMSRDLKGGSRFRN